MSATIRRFCALLFLLLPAALCARAQKTSPEVRFLKHEISTLAGTAMDGRGYYKDGRGKAAKYITRKLREYGLRPMGNDSAWTQVYTFSVNTFPGEVAFSIGRQAMEPSAQYLVDAGSSSGVGEKMKVTTIDCGSRKILAQVDTLPKLFARFTNQNTAYLLRNVDTLVKKLGIRTRDLRRALPKGTYIIPQKDRLIWTVATDTTAGVVFQVADTALPKKTKRISYIVEQKFEPAAKSENVLGFVPGTAQPDSFILFTAHYDHLGHMGHEAEFPGASDNASGTAMLLYLASYFAQHPQRYSIGFIAFSGEEAGLKGSAFFTQHPTINLRKVRFVTNLDIMGDATDGLSVVNGDARRDEFALLEKINTEKGYVPRLVSGPGSANSDHYHFVEQGIPAIFIFSRGGPGHYHDVFDKPPTLKLTNMDGAAKLIIDFAGALMR